MRTKPATPDRLIIIADAVSSYGPAPAVKDYVQKMAANWLKQGGEIAHQGIEADVGPQHFYRLDYVDPSGPTLFFKTFIATERRGYFLSWTFLVQKQEQLQGLIDSLQRVTFRD